MSTPWPALLTRHFALPFTGRHLFVCISFVANTLKLLVRVSMRIILTLPVVCMAVTVTIVAAWSRITIV